MYHAIAIRPLFVLYANLIGFNPCGITSPQEELSHKDLTLCESLVPPGAVTMQIA